MINWFRGKYAYLSNFYPCKVVYKNITFDNSESLFQALKQEEGSDLTKFIGLEGKQAKALGKKINMRKDWKRLRFAAMYIAVDCKFRQNEDLKKLLLATGNQTLIEGNTWGDKFWGMVKGVGENYLGKTLMLVRKELLAEQSTPSN